ncbi:competence protein ComE [Acinetobacter sp. NCu2D-2]|nr:competence protein ComE [Acinetobacter sp. NCu2D-2]
MNKPIQLSLGKTKLGYLILLMLSMIFSLSHATTPDYATWKSQQQQHDQRYKAEQTTTANHYLSKPQLSTLDSANKISLNRATLEQLQQLSGIGLKKAEAIVQYREKNGPFKRIEDLQLIKGIGPAIFNKNKARLTL